jgi:hypothetical protein
MTLSKQRQLLQNTKYLATHADDRHFRIGVSLPLMTGALCLSAEYGCTCTRKASETRVVDEFNGTVPSGFEDVTDVTGCNQRNKFVEILESERAGD